jgi:hypothetical protein
MGFDEGCSMSALSRKSAKMVGNGSSVIDEDGREWTVILANFDGFPSLPRAAIEREGRAAVFEWEVERDDIIREWEDFEVEGEITPSKEGDTFSWEVRDQYIVRNGRWVDTDVPVEGKYAVWWGSAHVEIIFADGPEQARQIFLQRFKGLRRCRMTTKVEKATECLLRECGEYKESEGGG